MGNHLFGILGMSIDECMFFFPLFGDAMKRVMSEHVKDHVIELRH